MDVECAQCHHVFPLPTPPGINAAAAQCSACGHKFAMHAAVASSANKSGGAQPSLPKSSQALRETHASPNLNLTPLATQAPAAASANHEDFELNKTSVLSTAMLSQVLAKTVKTAPSTPPSLPQVPSLPDSANEPAAVEPTAVTPAPSEPAAAPRRHFSLAAAVEGATEQEPATAEESTQISHLLANKVTQRFLSIPWHRRPKWRGMLALLLLSGFLLSLWGGRIWLRHHRFGWGHSKTPTKLNKLVPSSSPAK